MAYLKTFSTLGCPGLTLAEVFTLAEQHGMHAVELRALAGTTDLPAYFAAEYENPAALAAWARARSVQIVALGTSLTLAGATAVAREEFLRFVPWAEALGVPRLRVFDGGKTLESDELVAMTDVVAWWRKLRREHRWHTDIMVETHDSLLTAGALRRFRAVAPDTGILWDAHHTWRTGGEDPRATWAAISDAVVHVHVKDSVRNATASPAFVYVCPGDGEFPMSGLRELLASGFNGPVSLEWEKLWHPALPSLEVALEAARRRDWW